MKYLHIAYNTDDGIAADSTRFIFEQECGDIYCSWVHDLKILKGKRLAGDGTFKVIKGHKNFCQCYIISVIEQDQASDSSLYFPVFFALLKQKSKTSYTRFIRWINCRYRVVVNNGSMDDPLMPPSFIMDGFNNLLVCFRHYV